MNKMVLKKIKKVLFEILSVVLVSFLFWGILFALAEPFMTKADSFEHKKKQEQFISCKKSTGAVLVVLDDKIENKDKKDEMVCLGEFIITAYCGEKHKHICNDGDATKTATGTTPKEGRTIAVDPSIIPYGTTVYIDGKEYVAEDCGAAIKGNRADIFFESHIDALSFGVQNHTVYIKVCL